MTSSRLGREVGGEGGRENKRGVKRVRSASLSRLSVIAGLDERMIGHHQDWVGEGGREDREGGQGGISRGMYLLDGP